MKNKNEQNRRLLTVKQGADRTGYQATTIRQWANERRFPHVRLGRVIRIEESVLDDYIAKHTIPAEPSKAKAR
jgi:excisionase family DNA binding protein